MPRPTNAEGSNEYAYLVFALHAQWPEFLRLRQEFDCFKPPSTEERKPFLDAEFFRMQPINPDVPEDDLRKFIAATYGENLAPEAKRWIKFNEPLMAVYVTVALLSHALCEAVINHVIGFGLSQDGVPEVFKLLETATVVDKWAIGPKALSSSYQFPKGAGIDETLVRLTKQRNALVHYKGELKLDGHLMLEGKHLIRGTHEDRFDWIHRYFSLPFDLARFAEKSLPDYGGFTRLLRHEPIRAAPQHASS
jgi:hypothetical protein